MGFRIKLSEDLNDDGTKPLGCGVVIFVLPLNTKR